MSTLRRFLLMIPIILTVVWLGGPLIAQSQSYTVVLHDIQKIKTQEKSGDELYISVTEFPDGGTPKNYQIPNFPSHWLSTYLSNVKDVVLWEKSGSRCSGDTKVIFSLVEEDIPPWDLNDLIGSVVLDLKCEKGTFVSTWTIPNQANTSLMESAKPVKNANAGFIFKGDGAEYRATFHIQK